MSDTIIAGKKSDELLEYLLKRRSVSIKNLAGPGPDDEQIKTILRAATRVPDHGKLFPWYFIVLRGDARAAAGDLLEFGWREQDRNAAPAKLELERERFLRAPVVIAVVSRIRKSKNPVWEQIMSAGAVCQNLCLAANALGFGSNWVTEWYSYSELVKAEFGLDARDHFAGFVYLGTPAEQPEERERPDLEKIANFWEPGKKIIKGADYDRDGGWPEAGFDFSGLG